MIDKKHPSIEFNAMDRCDRCQAQAYSAFRKNGLELLFCLHHAREHTLALEVDQWVACYDFGAIERLVEPARVPANTN